MIVRWYAHVEELGAPEVENYATLVLGTLEALSDLIGEIEEKQELPGFDLQYSVGEILPETLPQPTNNEARMAY